MDNLALIGQLSPMAQGGYGWGMGPGMMGGYGYGGHGYWGIIMMVFFVAVIVGIVFLVRWAVISSRGPAQGAPREDEAMEILRKRFANGEIGKEEFEEKKKSLRT